METQIYAQETQGILLEDRFEGRQEVAPKNHARTTGKNASCGSGSKVEKEVAIYSLTDPRTGLVRYIGKSDNPKRRLCGHLRRPPSRGMRRWVSELCEAGFAPVLEIIERTKNWQESEKFWIAYYRIGGQLLNVTSGGNGPSPEQFTEDVRRRQSEGNKGKSFSDETRAKLSAANTGRKLSAETRAKMSASKKGKKKGPFSAEHCAAISRAKKGKKLPPHSPEHCAKISKALTGKKLPPLSPERRAEISRFQKGRKHSASHNANMRAAVTLYHARKREAAVAARLLT